MDGYLNCRLQCAEARVGGKRVGVSCCHIDNCWQPGSRDAVLRFGRKDYLRVAVAGLVAAEYRQDVLPYADGGFRRCRTSVRIADYHAVVCVIGKYSCIVAVSVSERCSAVP